MKKLKNIFYLICISEIVIVLSSCLVFEKQVTDRVGYQVYTVLSNSMEPRIPTYSAVMIKKIKKDETLLLAPQQIITFKANRFNEDIIVTHHFNKIEYDENGEILFRTNAEGKDNLDAYDTKREDIIGIYMFHIPYLGKIIMFLKSRFVFIWFGEITIILLINKLIKARWKEKQYV